MVINAYPLVDTWLRFVVLYHFGSPNKLDHYDILLELVEGEDTEAIALDKLECVSRDLSQSRLEVNPQEMIRRRYLTYEGLMSGNRGVVKRVDEGRYQLTPAGKLIFEGKILRGEYYLEEDAFGNLFVCRMNS